MGCAPSTNHEYSHFGHGTHYGNKSTTNYSGGGGGGGGGTTQNGGAPSDQALYGTEVDAAAWDKQQEEEAKKKEEQQQNEEVSKLIAASKAQEEEEERARLKAQAEARKEMEERAARQREEERQQQESQPPTEETVPRTNDDSGQQLVPVENDKPAAEDTVQVTEKPADEEDKSTKEESVVNDGDEPAADDTAQNSEQPENELKVEETVQNTEQSENEIANEDTIENTEQPENEPENNSNKGDTNLDASRTMEKQSRLPHGEDDDYTPPGFHFESSYKTTPLGLHEVHVDFRQNPVEYQFEGKPRIPPGELYTDPSFDLKTALPHSYQSHEWKRPTEIRSAPILFSDGTTKYDIGQGSMGTCWFLSMVSNIADRPELLKQVIPDGAYDVSEQGYNGLFRCRFWRYGVWDDIFTDDYLPIVHGNVISGAHSATDENEMWVALLEKAFARSYGSYKEVDGGLSADSYLSLTGGVAEGLEFSDMKMSQDELHHRLRNALNSGALICCSVPAKNDKKFGLVGGHAYSLTGVAEVNGTKLVRVRNPWGHHEWNGPWGDGKPEWNDVPPGTVENPNKDDGEFYMSLKDFLTYFEDVTICNVTPDFDRDGSNDTLHYNTSIYGDFRGENAAGFERKLKNPKYLIEITDESLDENGQCPVVLHMVQRELNRSAEKPSIRCDMYKVHKFDEANNTMIVEEVGFKNNHYKSNKQNVHRQTVTPGKYIVVPSTMTKGKEMEFMVRIFTAGPLKSFEDGKCARDLTNSGMIIMECSNVAKPEVDVPTTTLHSQIFGGEFVSGANAGGQVSNESFGNNPQFEIICHERSFVRFNLMQPERENMAPIGFKMFRVDEGEEIPMHTHKLWDIYSSGVQTCDGDDGVFISAHEATIDYVLDPGRYAAIIHLNDPSDQTTYNLLVRSHIKLDVNGFQL